MNATAKQHDSGTATVLGVNGNIVRIQVSGMRIMKNEVAFVCVGDQRLKAEVLRVNGDQAELQVFEETDGVRFGDNVELSGEMLSVSLGPGLLGTVYDGLQNPLAELAELDGFFLKRGRDVAALAADTTWDFTPLCGVGDQVVAGEVLGTTPERNIVHKIMVPFDTTGTMTVKSIAEGRLRTDANVATLTDSRGRDVQIPLVQTWPVRRPISALMQQQRLIEREFPSQPLITTTRIIDTFFPIARGGTACIPGPFGAGKTVLQGLIARYSTVDVVIVVACGERAGEVVETIHDFAEMPDPRTGGKLMDRTIIICNTSSMPVAAREASIYTGITLGEYYRQMGLDVLLLADSTSRWAQAMRETSGRLEEIPGEEAFPAYLDSAIKELYERAGVLRMADGQTGSLTMIGSVSPAGGNFEEPVTQSTLGTVKCFLGLSYDRAYKRFYPAIDPLISWSRYRDQLAPFFKSEVDPHWTTAVSKMHQLLRDGESIDQMMQVTGEEGISIEDYVTHQKAFFLDMVYLQQDAFDPVDVSVPLERQKEMFLLCLKLINDEYAFADKEQARVFFTELIGLFKNLNTAESDSEDFKRFRTRISELQATALVVDAS
ncbi:V-type sodium ATPase catalytic subunit A [Stieleria maiorica]|uniref:V-type ATP synthase alpha chain n=1 Tax=Stieleria maiorica TaxID=2795974 RepID=A0A5B9MK74_9BACT|nr:V-type ATP synthase subunit A [Stieleria maiorica]QEG01294.1 V-type sodium ATPase catalytic subunit A [Stieleria maiorica]